MTIDKKLRHLWLDMTMSSLTSEIHPTLLQYETTVTFFKTLWLGLTDAVLQVSWSVVVGLLLLYSYLSRGANGSTDQSTHTIVSMGWSGGGPLRIAWSWLYLLRGMMVMMINDQDSLVKNSVSFSLARYFYQKRLKGKNDKRGSILKTTRVPNTKSLTGKMNSLSLLRDLLSYSSQMSKDASRSRLDKKST